MSDDQELDNENEQEDRTPASLRAAAEAGKVAVAELARMRRENLFLKAGIDPEGNRAAQLLFKTFEGDDIEALKAEALELGIKLPGAETPATDELDQSAQTMRTQLRGGAAAGGASTPTPDPITETYEQFHADLQSGTPRDRAAVNAVDRVLRAAVAGDERVIFNPTDWYAGASPSVPSR